MPRMMQGTWRSFLFGLLMSLAVVAVVLIVGRRPPGHAVVLRAPPTPMPVRAHILGAVLNPGVHAVPRGSIVQSLIEAAGGTTTRADLSRLNLAQLVLDGDQFVVPELPPTPTQTPTPAPTRTPAPTITVGPGTATPTLAPTDKPAATAAPVVVVGNVVNINTATLAELDTLPRIGPAIAQRIIDYRTNNGPFLTKEEIMNVKGIGPATYEKLKDLITVGP